MTIALSTKYHDIATPYLSAQDGSAAFNGDIIGFERAFKVLWGVQWTAGTFTSPKLTWVGSEDPDFGSLSRVRVVPDFIYSGDGSTFTATSGQVPPTNAANVIIAVFNSVPRRMRLEFSGTSTGGVLFTSNVRAITTFR